MGDSTAPSRTGGPEPRWLLLPFPGFVAGGAFGVLLVWLAVLIVALSGRMGAGPLPDVIALSVAGGLFGALIGLVCGIPVGLVLMFVVGRDQPGPRASRRVFIVAAATHAVTLIVLMAVVGLGFAGTGILLLIGSPLVAGLVARWFHGRLARRHRFPSAVAD